METSGNLLGNFPDKHISESGIFHHIGGIVYSFTPNPDNIIEGGIDAPDGWCNGVRHYDNAIKTLIVPEGIKGFIGYFLRGWAITETVDFPDSLLSIGEENGEGCVFSDCYLPEIVLPGALKCLGVYAFGHSYIRKLTVAPTVKSKYNRQFKDSTIEELYLPKVILEEQSLSINNEDYTFYRNFYMHCHCNIIGY